MDSDRRKLPREVERDVLVEAGHPGYLSGPKDQRRAIAGRIARTHGVPRDRVLPGVPRIDRYTLTPEGREFVDALFRADDIK